MRTIVHIGLHKTGSTSIQHFLGLHRDRLDNLGIAYFRGQYIVNNHVELHVAAMRPDRSSTFKEKRGHVPTDEYRENVRAKVSDFAAQNPDKTLLFSAEGLSLLRYPDEIEWLAETLPKPTEIVAVVREVESYMASYAGNLALKGLEPKDRGSFAYVGPDSWLRNIQDRLDAFRPFFERVATVDFDKARAEDASVIPAFLRHLGIEHCFERSDWEDVFLNVSANKAAARNRSGLATL